MPTVSVIIPCRNAAAYLPQTIASLRAQTLTDFEVIAVDDFSSDETLTLLNAWAITDTRVRVLRSPTRGMVAALNAGCAQARAELIARMDSDDVAHPMRLEQQVRAFESDPRLGACGTQVRYFPPESVRNGALRYQQWLNSLVEPEQIVRDIFVECPIAHPTLMIRRVVLQDAGSYRDRDWPEDYDLILRLYAAGVALANVPAVLLDWRERADRVSRTDARYSEAAFRRCKVFYLRRTVLRERRDIVVWGAGPVGKAFARELLAAGVPVQAFVDVDPRKIGQRVYDLPVVSATQLGRQYTDAFVLAAVAGAQARTEIREALNALRRREGCDFVAVA